MADADKSRAEQALIKLDRELMDATVSNDMALFKRTALDGYVFVDPGGGLEEGTQPPPGPPAKFESLAPEDVRVRVHGDTAVLTGRATVKGQLGSGRDISGQYRYMRVFVRQGAVADGRHVGRPDRTAAGAQTVTRGGG